MMEDTKAAAQMADADVGRGMSWMKLCWSYLHYAEEMLSMESMMLMRWRYCGCCYCDS